MTNDKIPITIRVPAVLEAAKVVLALKPHLLEQKGLGPERVNDLRALFHVTKLMREGLVVVADRAGRLIGVAGAMPMVEDWSDDWYIDLKWLYAVPFNTKVTAGDMSPQEAASLRRETEESLLAEVERFADLKGLPLVSQTYRLHSENHDQIFTARRYLRLGSVHMRMPSEVMSELGSGEERTA